MSIAPRTLLQHANAPLHPSALSTSALIVIDAQEEYRAGRLPLAGTDDAIATPPCWYFIAPGNGTGGMK